MGNSSVYPNHVEMKADSPELAPELSHIPHHTGQWLDSFRQLQRCPETPITSLKVHQFQHSNLKKAPCTPNHLDIRSDYLASNEELCQVFTSTSRGGFPQQYVYERDLEFAASSGMDTKLP